MRLGLNVPPRGPHYAAETGAAGSEIVRLVATDTPDLGERINAYGNQDVLLVLAKESFGHVWPTTPQPFKEYARKHARQIAAVQIANEPDGPHGGTSAPLDKPTLNRMLEWGDEFRQVNPACKVIAPGLITGQPSWLAGVETERCDAIAVHAYWKTGAEIKDFLAQHLFYSAVRAVWVTEIDLRVDVLRALARIPWVEATTVYCFKRWAGWPLALVDEQGGRLPLYGEFIEAQEAIMADTMEALRAELDLVKKQQALQTAALAATGQLKFKGAGSLEAFVRALDPAGHATYEAVDPKS